MAAPETASKGLLRCRDLVAFYWGVRVVCVASQHEVAANHTGQWFQALEQDPARIRYEIVCANEDPANAQEVDFLTASNTPQNQDMEYMVPANDTKVIVRDFTTDGDAVTQPVQVRVSSTAFVISVRETRLSPLPVDESL